MATACGTVSVGAGLATTALSELDEVLLNQFTYILSARNRDTDKVYSYQSPVFPHECTWKYMSIAH